MVFYPPGIKVTTRNGGLAHAVSGVAMPLVVGYSSKLDAGKLCKFAGGSSEVLDVAGRGSGAELAASIADATGCLFLSTGATTSGTLGAVTPVRVSTSTGTVAWTGTPYDAYRLRIRIVKAGGLGEARFQYALDGYSTTEAFGWSPVFTVPAAGSFSLPQTGTAIAFTAGAGPVIFALGDVFHAESVAPHYTTADLTTAFGALRSQLGSLKVRRAMLAGTNVSGSSAMILAAAFAGHLDTLATHLLFSRGVIDAGSSDTAANVLTARASFNDDRVGLVYDPQTATAGCHIVSRVPFDGWSVPRVSAANAVAERFAQTDLSEALERVLSGSLRGVVSIGNDEVDNPLFTAEDRIITLCKQPEYSGFFVTKGFIASNPSSDFRTLQWGCIADEMSEISSKSTRRWIGSNLQAATDGTGAIEPEDATRVQTLGQNELSQALKEPVTIEGTKGHVSDVTFTVSRTNDFLSTGDILATCSAVPLREVDGGYITIGFVRSTKA